MMDKKRTVSKKKRSFRPGCLLWLLILGAAAGVAVILILRPSANGPEPAGQVSDALWDGSWYEDELHRISKDGPLIEGMKAFEKKTGAKPYLKLLNGVAPEELDAFARDQYEALFSEGDHLLAVYDEWGENAYYLSARTGAGSALSSEDVSLLLACIERAYADPANGSYAEAFGAGFREGGLSIAQKEQGSGGVGLLLTLGLLLAFLAVVLVLFLRKRARYTGD